jgi:hypothetical protein
MSDGRAARPPYLAALVVGLVVLVGYFVTLAPSVTFWDAGEFIAASRILGIPHPPGTPLFVMMAHVWATIVPIGEWAWRTNLLSAICGATGAACWFLIAHETVRSMATDLDERLRQILAAGGATSAAVLSAFCFTMWQNSNETEVYAIAVFTIAAVCWLALRWRASRGTVHGSRMLLLAIYLGGISIGNHLLALLVGPALVTFLFVTAWREPIADAVEQRRVWGEVAVVGGLWMLLIGSGLGNTTLVFLGAIAFGAALVLAIRRGAGQFAVLAFILAAVGITTYLFLYIRAGQNPAINEADPSTWKSLLAVIRREQYGIRTPFDDPTQLHGPDNTGRTLRLIGLQLLNYIQYFDWQWAKSVTASFGAFPVRTAMTLLFLWLGTRGIMAQRRADRGAWWLLMALFLTTGLGLVAYMNFKPGFSIGYEYYPRGDDHEVRERDYFFIASFIVWGVWAGIGLAHLARKLMERLRGQASMAAAVFILAALPFALNFKAASRKHGADATLAGDFAYDLLNTVPPYGVLFTFGDNDTFPLWWAQEVAGVRKDVTVICLALAETDWYMRQMRENPTRRFEPESAPAMWRGYPVGNRPDWHLHTMSDEDVLNAVPQLLPRDVSLRIGTQEVTLKKDSPLYGKDFLSIRVLQENFGKRPIVWALSAAGQHFGLNSLLVQRGIGIYLDTQPADSLNPRYDFLRMLQSPLDIPVTDSLANGVYRYAALLERGAEGLETTSLATASTLSLPFTQMAYAAQSRGNLEAAIQYLEKAAKLSVNPAIRGGVDELRRQRDSAAGKSP